MYSLLNAVSSISHNLEPLNDVEKHASEAMTLTVDITAELLQRNKDVNGVEDQLVELKQLMSDYVELENDIRCFSDAANEIVATLRSSTQDFPNNIRELLDDTYSRNSKPAEVSAHRQYKELLRTIYDSQTANEDVPATQEEVTNDDSDIIMTQESSVPLDPFTRLEVTDPVRNKFCKHVYEREAVLQHITSRRGRCRCPVSGCSNSRNLTEDCLEEHNELRCHLRRNRVQLLS